MPEILVIEDETAIRNNIVRMLEQEGYETRSAGDGRSGVDRALARRPDLIISDVLMPGLDGFGVLDELRERDETAGVPFIFLTGLEDRAHFRRGMGLGADDYLNKPFRRDELLQAVQVRLARAAAAGRREAERHAEREERLQELFRRSLLGETQDKIVDEEIADHTGEIRTATVLFSDIRDFTTISERLSAQEVARLLNAYFREACEPLAACGAKAMKFMGDGVMAVFDAHGDDPRPASRRALQAALGMALAANRFRGWLAANFAGRGLPDFAIGVGVHEGEVMLCSVGSRDRREYTAIGDTVNLASRLEGKTKELGWSVAASATTLRNAGPGIEVGGQRVVEVRGRSAPVAAVEVTGIASIPGEDDTLRVRLADDIREALRINSEITGRAVKAALATTQTLRDMGLPRIGGYRLTRAIGKGGMSRVYLARREADGGREIVLKVLDARSGDEDLLQRFLQEYALIAHIDHPNVVRIHDQGIADDLAYIAMEHFAGGDVRARLARGLAASECAAIVAQAAAALDEVHRHGIVHRDVKPDNLMLRVDGSVALADFGIAKHARDSLAATRHGDILGTPYYLSPEQCDGHPASPASDLYALGVTAFEMLTGVKPFRASSVEELLAQHRLAAVPALPPQLAAWQPLVDRLMAKRPDERFARAGDVVAALPKETP